MWRDFFGTEHARYRLQDFCRAVADDACVRSQLRATVFQATVDRVVFPKRPS